MAEVADWWTDDGRALIADIEKEIKGRPRSGPNGVSVAESVARMLVRKGYVDAEQSRALWKNVAAKLAFLLITERFPTLPKAEREDHAGTLLAGCVETERDYQASR